MIVKTFLSVAKSTVFETEACVAVPTPLDYLPLFSFASVGAKLVYVTDNNMVQTQQARKNSIEFTFYSLNFNFIVFYSR